MRNLSEHLFRRTSAKWATASLLTLLLSSHNLLTGYKQLSYYEFDRNLSIRVSLAKDWFMLYQKFNQDLATLVFKQKIDSFEISLFSV